jgi:TolB-like protein/Flp pilus assembly protein TadD
VKPKKFFVELKRRKVYRLAVAYAVVGWLLIQIVTQTFPFFEIPSWAVRLVILLLLLGFPVALILSWAFDLTPEGVVRTDEALPIPPEVTSPRPQLRRLPVADKSIAVLPFENLSDDQENEYFADGIQDDILANLARIADLKVISRTSVRQYKTGTRNLREIGEELGVAHILEGTVRRAGKRARVNVQLINAATDAHVWANSFDRELTDLFALQSELAEQITIALRANLSPKEKAGLKIHATANLEAYENFLRARDFFRWSGAGDPRENGEKALRYLDRAIALDPEFALAYSLASRCHAELFWFGFDRSSERLEKAKAAAEAALRVHPEGSDGQVALAFYHYYGFRDYGRARERLEQARRATPNDAEIWDAFGTVNRREGRWADAVAHLEKARELDPRNPSGIWNLAETYGVLGQLEEAEGAIAQGLEVNPEAHFFTLLRATLALRNSGDAAPLRAALREVPREFDPGGSVTLVAFRLHLMERNFDEATRLLATSSHARYNDTGLGGMAAMVDSYSFPQAWLEGLLARARGDEPVARRAFTAALEDVDDDLCCCSDDAKAIMMRAFAQAALGRKEEAREDAEEAAAMLSISLDAYDGPMLATNLAAVYAEIGETEKALTLLESLRGIPMAATPGILRLEREWDPLRNNPRFQALCEAQAESSAR